MQTQDVNPDPRSLPAGWTQHFESTKQLWYYVQMSVTPPKVSFTHPIDMVPASRKGSPYPPMDNTQMPQPQLVVPPMQTSQNPSQSGSKLTFAQQLYASSLSSSLSPMINSQFVPTPQLPPIHIRNLPTPPPSSSPPPGTGAHFLNAPSNGSDMPPPFYQSSSHTMNHPSASTPSTAPPFLNPHRTNSQTPIPSNNSHPQRHRAFSYDPVTSQRSVNVNPSVMADPRPTRHLVTMARPPDQQFSSALSPLILEPPTTAHSAPAVPSPPPASSILFSQTTATGLTLPLTPPLTTVQSTPVTSPNISSLSISPFGRVTGVGSLAGGVVSTLQSVLLTPGTGVDQLSLQAVVQGRPDADYQRIINALIKLHHQQQQQFALMKLQMQQPPPPAIDYKVLIAEVQKIQAQKIATAQQQQCQSYASVQLQEAHQQQQQQYALHSLQGQQQQPQTAAQQYQALVQQKYQQQAAAQQQLQLQQVLAQQQQQQQQQQQAAQYQALLQQQQQQAAALAQQNQALLNNAARPPHQQPQQQHENLQSAIKPYLETYKVFENLNLGGNTGGDQAQPLFDPNSLFSTDGGGGGGGLFDNGGGASSGLFSGGNFGGQDSLGGFDFMSVSFNQDNSGGFDINIVDTSGQSNY